MVAGLMASTAIDTVKSKAKSTFTPGELKKAFDTGLSEGFGGGAVTSEKTDLSMFYTVNPNDWYKTYPFYFQFFTKEGTAITFYLPIPPQQMTMQQMTTSEAHATIGGVVTEVSAPVFYNINMVGTTGLSLNAVGVSNPGSEVKGRQTFEDLSGGGGVASKLARSLSKNIESLANVVTPEETVPFFKYGSAVNTLTEDEPASVTWENLATAPTGEGPTANKAIGKMIGQVARSFIGNVGDNKQPSWYLNGFTWEHALKQFFLIYQRERSKGTVGQLYFIDSKSNNQFACVPKAVQFSKASNQPYISQYTIALKCWSDAFDGFLSASNFKAKPIDRFEGDLAEVYTVSAASVITSFKKTVLKFNRVKDVGGAMVRDAGGSAFG
jgi:hypothetical protein